MRQRIDQKEIAAAFLATLFSNRWRRLFTARLVYAFGICILISTPQSAIGQATAKPTLVIRNVWIANELEKTSHHTDVMLANGKLAPISASSSIPSDATVIDGGGNTLTLNADGSIKLTQRPQLVANSPASDVSPQATAQPLVEPISYKKAALQNRADPSSPGATQSPPSSQTQHADGDLAQKVTDPSAPLKSITFQNRYVPSQWGIDDDVNEFSVQIAVPYKLGGKAQIFRAIIPYLTNTPSPGSNGVGDVALLNVTVLPRKWGTMLLGPVVSIGTNKGPGVDTFAIGPALGAIFRKGKFTYGVFNQNLFSFGGDIKVSQIQPILSYTLNKKVSFAIGDAQTTIDWNQKKFVAVPLSFQINYIAILGKQPMRLFINPQFSPVNNFGQRKWTIGGGFALLLP